MTTIMNMNASDRCAKINLEVRGRHKSRMYSDQIELSWRKTDAGGGKIDGGMVALGRSGPGGRIHERIGIRTYPIRLGFARPGRKARRVLGRTMGPTVRARRTGFRNRPRQSSTAARRQQRHRVCSLGPDSEISCGSRRADPVVRRRLRNRLARVPTNRL
jgi:hypothetical protein